MPEAEDVITDAARHATVFVRDLWLRRRATSAADVIDTPQVLHRLDLLITAAFAQSCSLRLAQPPPPRPFLRKVFRSYEQPAATIALPATNGTSIWLPSPSCAAAQDLRIIALHQAARAHRGSPDALPADGNPLQRAIYEVLEAAAADFDLSRRLGGLTRNLAAFRSKALQSRPALAAFPPARRPLEQWVRSVMKDLDAPTSACSSTPQDSLQRADEIALRLLREAQEAPATIAGLLFRDCWTGELRSPPSTSVTSTPAQGAVDRHSERAPPRSARLTRRPQVRVPDERDEQAGAGVWMVQTAQPHEHAEDAFGIQRPTDRDESTAAGEFADSVSELAEARLVSTPGSPKEILLSDDPPDAPARGASPAAEHDGAALTYPEWDWRAGDYRKPGATVHLLQSRPGPREWVVRTLEEHRAMLDGVRRQFESLRPRRVRLREQSDGEELDLDACIDAFADARAGAALPPGLYQCTRPRQREMAVLLLIDVSGSTDGWISNQRRIIDVEREALLLVCLALESLGEPYSVLAFSGEGPAGVTVRSIKHFAERYGDETALRIAGLEPEHYTRAGAAIRHATALLMREPVRHRLLLVLSDGKPNDADEYEGRYGVEDMRQAVTEARLQGVYPFCLTIDRHTAAYLPAIFGEHQYAVLHRPELLPTALLGWLRRLVRT